MYEQGGLFDEVMGTKPKKQQKPESSSDEEADDKEVVEGTH